MASRKRVAYIQPQQYQRGETDPRHRAGALPLKRRHLSSLL